MKTLQPQKPIVVFFLLWMCICSNIWERTANTCSESEVVFDSDLSQPENQAISQSYNRDFSVPNRTLIHDFEGEGDLTKTISFLTRPDEANELKSSGSTFNVNGDSFLAESGNYEAWSSFIEGSNDGWTGNDASTTWSADWHRGHQGVMTFQGDDAGANYVYSSTPATTSDPGYVSFWIKPSWSTNNQLQKTFFCVRDAGNSQYFLLYFSLVSPTVTVESRYSGGYTTVGTFTYGTWAHIQGYLNPGTDKAYWYVNGVSSVEVTAFDTSKSSLGRLRFDAVAMGAGTTVTSTIDAVDCSWFDSNYFEHRNMFLNITEDVTFTEPGHYEMDALLQTTTLTDMITETEYVDVYQANNTQLISESDQVTNWQINSQNYTLGPYATKECYVASGTQTVVIRDQVTWEQLDSFSYSFGTDNLVVYNVNQTNTKLISESTVTTEWQFCTFTDFVDLDFDFVGPESLWELTTPTTSLLEDTYIIQTNPTSNKVSWSSCSFGFTSGNIWAYYQLNWDQIESDFVEEINLSLNCRSDYPNGNNIIFSTPAGPVDLSTVTWNTKVDSSGDVLLSGYDPTTTGVPEIWNFTLNMAECMRSDYIMVTNNIDGITDCAVITSSLEASPSSSRPFVSSVVMNSSRYNSTEFGAFSGESQSYSYQQSVSIPANSLVKLTGETGSSEIDVGVWSDGDFLKSVQFSSSQSDQYVFFEDSSAVVNLTFTLPSTEWLEITNFSYSEDASILSEYCIAPDDAIDVFIQPGNYIVLISENSVIQESRGVTINASDNVLIFGHENQVQVDLTFTSQTAQSLLFSDYETTVSYTKYSEFFSETLDEPLFYADDGTSFTISIIDKIWNIEVLSQSLAVQEGWVLTLDVYSLRVKNTMQDPTRLWLNSTFSYEMLPWIFWHLVKLFL